MFKKEEPGRGQGPAPRQGFEQESAGYADGPRSDTSSAGREAAVIGRSIHIRGDLRGDEDLRIDGDVSGTIELKNNSLTIGKDGKIRADVHAKVITVEGHVEGDLFGSERVNIRKTARVIGNATAPRVSLEDGARFKGAIEMDPDAVEAAVGKPQAAKPASAQTFPAQTSPAVAPKPATVSTVSPVTAKT